MILFFLLARILESWYPFKAIGKYPVKGACNIWVEISAPVFKREQQFRTAEVRLIKLG